MKQITAIDGKQSTRNDVLLLHLIEKFLYLENDSLVFCTIEHLKETSACTLSDNSVNFKTIVMAISIFGAHRSNANVDHAVFLDSCNMLLFWCCVSVE